ncbi:MAG: SRPBCC family protein [Pyrinomonadaceae bacterium]
MSAREETLTKQSTGGGAASATREGQGNASTNVGQAERLASTIGGGALAIYGLTRGSLGGIALALVGGALVQRGLSGHCSVYDAMNFSTAEGGNLRHNENVSVPGDRGVKLEKSITINRSPEELYTFWRNFENLPRIMNHLESVRVTGETRSHWVAKAPAGMTVEWDAEIYNEKANELIAWRSLEGADVDSAGSVRFEREAGGRGTVVRVNLKYDPPGGVVGAAIAKLFGENPAQQIDEDLRRFKMVMETGETATTKGQSSGRNA